MELGSDTHPVLVTANNALGFDGTDDYVDIGTGPSGVKCVEFRVNPGSTTEYFVDLDGGTHFIWANAGTVTATGFSSPAIYVNGVETTAIAANQWQHVAVTTDTGINVDALAMGKSGSNYFQGKMDEVRLWGVAPSLTTLRSWMYREVNSLHPEWNDMGAYYKFNAGSGTTAHDFRNGYDGVLTNGPAWMTSGAFEGPRNGLDFDGTNDYVDIGTGPGTVKTVSFWVYPSSAGGYFMDLDGGTHFIWANAGTVTAAGFSSPAIYVNGVETTAIAANQWQHVAVTTDTGINADDLDIGVSGSNYLQGRMDEVRIWNDVRTATEIRDNMCRSLAGNEDGLSAYYRFDQYNTVGQTTLYDITGNGYNGTLTDMDPATDWVPSTAYNAWVGSDGTDWATGGNWSLYAQPGTSDNAGVVHYASPGNAPAIGAAAVSRHLVVATDATLTLGANTLTLNGNWIKNGTASVASGSVVFSGAEGAGIIGETIFNHLTVDKSSNSVILGNNVGVNGTLRLTNGELNNGSATLTLGNGATIERSGGSLTNAPAFTTSVDVVYSGATGITTGHELPTSTTILNDLTVNKAGGVVVNADATVNHTLTLTDGLVTLGDNDLSLSLNATLGGAPSASNMVATNGTGVFKKVFGGTGSFTFPVGDNTATAEYSPVTLNFTSGTFNSAHAAVGATNAKQPQNPSTTDYLNRYWSVTQSGITGFSCTATFSYQPADVQGTETNIYGGQYKDASWTVFDAVNTGSHTFEATVSDFSDFSGIEAATPAAQANNISFGNVAQTQMQVSWTRGDGDNVLIVAHQGSAVDSNPVDGTGYNADATFGSGSEIGTGNFVVYNGTGTSVTVTGLTANTTYYFRAYEYNDTVYERYNTDTATGNPGDRTTLPNAPSAPVATGASSITGTGFTVNWNAAAGASGYRLDVSTDNGFGNFVSGYENKDVGNVTTSPVTSLSAGTTYYYRIRAENTGGISGDSNTITFATTDGTGVPAKIQDAAPNNGDGNGDNIKDSKQTNVASLPSAPDGSYLTVELFGCDQIENVETCTYESMGKPDPGYTYPLGLVGFNIPCTTSTVIIYYHGADNFEGYTYRKYGPTPVDWDVAIWYAMTGVTFGTKEIGGDTVPYVEFVLAEAQLGDDTPTFPIVDQGGIARAGAIPTMNEWGIIIMALLLVGTALGTIRRQRIKE